MTDTDNHSYQRANTTDHEDEEGNSNNYQNNSENANSANATLNLQDDIPATTLIIDNRGARRTLVNFIWMSIFFSANHGCVVACLSLATARLGSTGAWQSGILYLCYTASAVLGATYVVKQLGARNSLIAGMLLYCAYVACFLIATILQQQQEQQHQQVLDEAQQRQLSIFGNLVTTAALFGAAIGGVGAGFLWTAQGSYFGRAAEDHASHLKQAVEESNSMLASIFAFLYLAEEVALRALSSFLLEWGWAWSVVFWCYTAVAVISTVLMGFVYDYPTNTAGPPVSASLSTEEITASPTNDLDDNTPQSLPASPSTSLSVWYKVTAAWQLLRNDPKMKHMIGLNAVFGLTSAFLNSYINGEVVRVATHDDKSTSVGLFNAWVSCVAAAMSLVFGKLSNRVGKGPVLIIGALCFFGVVFPFVLVPDTHQWGVPMLVMVYSLHGTGRATFEGTLKATFADLFSYEKEGAFANIILQNGLSGAIGYVLTFNLVCSEESRYCVKYSDESFHDVLSFELLVIISAVMAIIGYTRASALYRAEVSAAATREEQNAENTAMIPLSTSAGTG